MLPSPPRRGAGDEVIQKNFFALNITCSIAKLSDYFITIY
jgi:hypothetical protein